MKTLLSSLPSLLVLVLLGTALPSTAQAPAAAEDKLREALKGVTLQLRTAQSEAATANAEKAVAETKNAELTAQVEKMSKQLAALSREKADAMEAAARMQENLEGRLTAKQQELTQFQKSLDKWKAAHSQISDLARKKERARASYAAKNAALERRVADLRTRNMALFTTGNEILDRFRKFSLGEAIAAREPFTGLTRVKLQNQLQEYGDKLLDQTAQP
jgi:chromosome segregation ATPase